MSNLICSESFLLMQTTSPKTINKPIKHLRAFEQRTDRHLLSTSAPATIFREASKDVPNKRDAKKRNCRLRLSSPPHPLVSTGHSSPETPLRDHIRCVGQNNNNNNKRHQIMIMACRHSVAMTLDIGDKRKEVVNKSKTTRKEIEREEKKKTAKNNEPTNNGELISR